MSGKSLISKGRRVTEFTNYIRCSFAKNSIKKAFLLLTVIVGCWLSVNVNAASINRQVSTNYEQVSLTLGTQWVVPAPAHVFHGQTGQCNHCAEEYLPFWVVEQLDATLSRYQQFVLVKVLQGAVGCQFPADCQTDRTTTFLAIDSKKLRQHHADNKTPPANNYNYCLQSSYSLLAYINHQVVNTQAPDSTTFCFSEMPMPESLVVYTNDDFLGDHDCGVFPPRGNNRVTARPLETLLSSAGEPFYGSGTASPQSAKKSGPPVDIRFLDGGAVYSNVTIVRSGKELLKLLPVKENTVVILHPDDFGLTNAGLENADLETGASDTITHLTPSDQSSRYGSSARNPHPKRLEHTEKYPEGIGHRDTVFTITSEDVLGYLQHHSTSRQNGLIEMVEPQSPLPTLMVIGHGDGVKLTFDIEDVSALQQKSLFDIRGTVQLYNIDVEASLPEGRRLFQVDHHLQLYRSSVNLRTVGKLFTGSGLVTASRSLLRENGHTATNRERDDCLMLRSCRSDITLNNWQASSDELTAMSGGHSYFGDYLDRAELLLPVKPEQYRQSIINDSALSCNDIASQALIPSNWFSKQTTVPPELRDILCPDSVPLMDHFRPFSQSPTVPAAQWQEGDCRCGRFVDSAITEEVGSECADQALTVAPTPTSAMISATSRVSLTFEPGPSPDAPLSGKNDESSLTNKLIGLGFGVFAGIAVSMYCYSMVKAKFWGSTDVKQ